MAPRTGTKERPPRLILSSGQFPADLDNRARLGRWRQIRQSICGSFEDTPAADRPFSARLQLARFGTIGVAEFEDTFVRVARPASAIASDGSDDFLIAINAGGAALLQTQCGREAMLQPGALSLFSNADPGLVQCAPGTVRRLLVVPRKKLTDLASQADDLIARPLGPGDSAARFLHRYLGMLLDSADLDDDPLLVEHIETTLLDLIALTLGAGRDASELASCRGLKAARIRAVLTEIRSGFAQPGFSARDVGARLGLSARYVQNLIAETGVSFSERVTELRLQKARRMLTGHNPLTPIDQIAYACGFNHVPYFNRRFRRRFGLTPTDARSSCSL